MNCKIGDLAIVIGRSTAVGRICEVVATCPRGVEFNLPDGHAHEPVEWEWIIRLQNPIAVPTSTGRKHSSFWLPCPDRVLRPVSGIPMNDEVTEDLKEPA